MIKTGMLVAQSEYRDWFFTEVKVKVDFGDVEMHYADSVDEVERILATNTIDIVFLGHGPEEAPEIVERIKTISPATSIHIPGFAADDFDPYRFFEVLLKAFA